LACSFSQMPKNDYEKSIKGLHTIAHRVFISIFFAGIGIYFSYGCLSVPYYLVAIVLAITTFGKFAGAILAAAVAKLKPVLTIGTGVMANGAVNLAILLWLLSAGMVQPDLFSLAVFGIMIMILAASATLKRGICLGRQDGRTALRSGVIRGAARPRPNGGRLKRRAVGGWWRHEERRVQAYHKDMTR
jgi:Kef-type K+ transport system membrane component KefB